MIELLLRQKNLDKALNPKSFVDVKPVYGEALREFIKNLILNENSKTLIFGDGDVDGILSTKIVLSAMNSIGYTKISVYKQTYKIHGITKQVIYDAKKNGVTHLIIVDSSTNNIEELKLCKELNIEVLVIDHHNPEYTRDDYPSNCLIINQKLEIQEYHKVIYKEVSCGMLCCIYFQYILNFICGVDYDLYVYGAITLYSDVMNVQDAYNMSVINYVRNSLTIPRDLVSLGRKGKKNFNRDYISFSIVPKLNTCIRAERFDLIDKLLFSSLTTTEIKEVCLEINALNRLVKQTVNELNLSTLEVKKFLKINYVDITRYINNFIINYKGYLANYISSGSNISVVYYILDGIVYGSVRDPLGRDLLSIFKLYSNMAQGHNSAFGFEIEEYKLMEMFRNISYSIECMERNLPEEIYVNLEDLNEEDIYKIKLYNEYEFNNPIFINVKVTPDAFNIGNVRDMFIVKSEMITFTSSKPVTYNREVVVKATLDQCRVI